MSKLETIVCPKNSKFYYVKSSEELAAEQAADAKVGRFLDSAGESILYSNVASSSFLEDTPVTITRRRGVNWPHWSKRPAHLVEGLATIEGSPRIIMVVNRH